MPTSCTFIPPNPTKGEFTGWSWFCPSLICWKAGVVQDVRRTSVIYQHPFSHIIRNEQSNDNCIVMWVMNSSSIIVCECNGLLVCPPRPWWSTRELEVLYHLQVRLSWPGRLPCRRSSYNNSYFSKWGPWWLFYLSLQLLVLVISSKEVS